MDYLSCVGVQSAVKSLQLLLQLPSSGHRRPTLLGCLFKQVLQLGNDLLLGLDRV